MNLIPRLKKDVITPEQVEMKQEAERVGLMARRELVEAREIASVLRELREKNHFASSFRRALGGRDYGD